MKDERVSIKHKSNDDKHNQHLMSNRFEEDINWLAPYLALLSNEQKQNLNAQHITQIDSLKQIIDSLNLGEDANNAAVLQQLSADSPIQSVKLKKHFSDNVVALYERLAIMNVFSNLSNQSEQSKKLTIENLRRMLLAMVDDVRVVLIKLAQQLVYLKSAKQDDSPKRLQVAKETLDLFAPLANRLGVWQLKWELEDYSLRYLNPEIYTTLAKKLAERRSEREEFINTFTENIRQTLKDNKIDSTVYGRPKHIYSIWRKMQRKGIEFEQIYDVRAIRIIVDTVHNCYVALGIVHTQWPNIPGEFDDYIAVPKQNGYRSIHTAVVSEIGKVMEIQIRTHEMHKENELGVAAHWRYKEQMKDESLDKKILWLRHLLEWKDEIASTSNIINEFRTEIADERIYVFTPNGNVIDLPLGATPIDFAYAVHSEVGHRCRGAKVNGRIVTLNYQLQTAEQVEILTVKKGGPSRDWLLHDNAYVVTSKARSRIQHWFKNEDRDKNVAEGRKILERGLNRLSIQDLNLEKLANANEFKNAQAMFAAIGFGDVKVSQILTKIKTPNIPPPLERRNRLRKSTTHSPADDINIEGVGNLYTQIAKCCNPLPGDKIIGFITVGRGITVHKSDCKNLLRLTNRAQDRLIHVSWGNNTHEAYKTDIHIKAYDRQGLLNDITSVMLNEKINLLQVNSYTDKTKNISNFQLSVEMPSVDELSFVLNRLAQIKNVIEVKRTYKN